MPATSILRRPLDLIIVVVFVHFILIAVTIGEMRSGMHAWGLQLHGKLAGPQKGRGRG